MPRRRIKRRRVRSARTLLLAALAGLLTNAGCNPADGAVTLPELIDFSVPAGEIAPAARGSHAETSVSLPTGS